MRITRSCSAALALVALSALAACGEPAHSPGDVPADVHVAIRTGAITAPDSVRPGWTRVRVDETEGEHIVVVFRLPMSASTTDASGFVAALDTAPATPPPGVAIGGPEIGARGDVIVHLTPGEYVLACVRRGDDGHRHASTGEFRMLHVRTATTGDSAFAAAPSSAQDVRMVDFAYIGPEHWAPGAQLLRIENTGKQDHQLRLLRLRDGASVQGWMTAEDPDTVATAIAGMARVGAGQVAYLPVDLTPGTYIAYCLIADAASKRPHVEMGMLRSIQVP